MKNRFFRLMVIFGILFLICGLIALFLTDSAVAGFLIFLSLVCNCSWAVMLQNKKHEEKSALAEAEAEKLRFKPKKKKKH